MKRKRERRTTTERGYGYQHQLAVKAYRAAFVPGQPCARCHFPLWPEVSGNPWRNIQLGHLDGSGKTAYAGLEHRRCNQLAGARQGGRVIAQRKRARKYGLRVVQPAEPAPWTPSRDW